MLMDSSIMLPDEPIHSSPQPPLLLFLTVEGDSRLLGSVEVWLSGGCG